MNDLEYIKSLELEIGISLLKLPDEDILTKPMPGYSMDTKKRVIQINIDKYKLTQFPNMIFHFKILQGLSLYKNQFETISPQISQLTALHTLYLCTNKLSTFPSEIGQLRTVRKHSSLSIN